MTRILPALLLALPVLAADPKPDAAAVEHFEKTVRPLLVQQCGKCHIDKGKGGLKLDTRANLLKGGDTGPVVVPGDAVKSLLVQSLKYDGELKMPPAGKLKPHEIEAVSKWVAEGAVWPSSDTGVSVATPGGPLFTAEQKQFWAFQPVKRPDIPAVSRDTKGRASANPVDAFIQHKLEQSGLKLSSPADKRTLLRRVHFDLTGLPPAPDDLAAFEKDTSPDAFARVVDKLLASPHYGERWGRHWLDVARYADTNGMDENTLFGNAWKYRDYVVNSFNADKPYDVFLREQIAGDLLPPTDDEKVRRERFAALGFLAIGPKLLAEPDKQKMLLDIADEQLDTVGKSVLGLTLGCARCHDHKFDPVPTRDYYSLLAVFTSTRTMQNLNTVAKAFERTPDGPEKPEVTKARAELEKLRKEVREVEKQFGKTKEDEKAKRQELHEKAEVKRAAIKKLEATIPPTEFYLGVEDGTAAAYGTAPRNLHVQVRGNYTTPGDEAPAVFPRILAGENQQPFVTTKPNRAAKPEANKTRFGQVRERSGRLELAHWLTDPKNPLTARVMVNRVWQHHFGEGLVRTPDNFGRLGERPTHPELLEWLAAEFVVQGWSLKKLHKLLLLSQTYQQASGNTPNADPHNRLLSCFPRRRLEAESLRDSMLAVSGQLDRTVGGTIHTGNNLDYVGEVKYDTNRRSVYLPVVRGKLFPFFITFDFPDPGVTVGKRATTIVAPQALFLLNNPFVKAQAEATAGELLKLKTPAERVVRLYRLAYQREPTAAEPERVLAFVSAFASGEKAERAAWAAAAQSLFASSEFCTVE
jgi:mono/diheme cytochrome c family protein